MGLEKSGFVHRGDTAPVKRLHVPARKQVCMPLTGDTHDAKNYTRTCTYSSSTHEAIRIFEITALAALYIGYMN